jgi:hypothetical protein
MLATLLLAVVFAGAPARAGEASTASVADAATGTTAVREEGLSLHNRHIVTFRAIRAGISPAERAEAARLVLESAVAGNGLLPRH